MGNSTPVTQKELLAAVKALRTAHDLSYYKTWEFHGPSDQRAAAEMAKQAQESVYMEAHNTLTEKLTPLSREKYQAWLDEYDEAYWIRLGKMKHL